MNDYTTLWAHLISLEWYIVKAMKMRLEMLVESLPSMHQSLSFYPEHCINWTWWGMSVIPALEVRLED